MRHASYATIPPAVRALADVRAAAVPRFGVSSCFVCGRRFVGIKAHGRSLTHVSRRHPEVWEALIAEDLDAQSDAEVLGMEPDGTIKYPGIRRGAAFRTLRMTATGRT